MQTILIIFAVYGILDLIFSTILYTKNPYLAQEVLRTVKSLFKKKHKLCELDDDQQTDCSNCGNCNSDSCYPDEAEQCQIEDDECVECGVCGKSFDEDCDCGEFSKYDENGNKFEPCDDCDTSNCSCDCGGQCGKCLPCLEAMDEYYKREMEISKQDHQLNDSEESMMKYKGEE